MPLVTDSLLRFASRIDSFTGMTPEEGQASSSNKPLDCRFRQQSSQMGIYYCHHEKVHTPGKLVTLVVCDLCQFRERCCDNRVSQAFVEQKPPAFPKQVWNFARALSAFVADGLTTVTEQQYKERLAVCEQCNYRKDNRCLKCGCQLLWKARGRAFTCPVGKWPAIVE